MGAGRQLLVATVTVLTAVVVALVLGFAVIWPMAR